jgi:hypothetical protein
MRSRVERERLGYDCSRKTDMPTKASVLDPSSVASSSLAMRRGGGEAGSIFRNKDYDLPIRDCVRLNSKFVYSWHITCSLPVEMLTVMFFRIASDRSLTARALKAFGCAH